MKYFTVSIPVKPFIKRYIEKKFAPPYFYSLQCPVGSLLHICIEKKQSNPLLRFNKNRPTNQATPYTDNIKLKIPQYYIHQHKAGLHLHPHTANIINNYFELLMVANLHEYCIIYEEIKIKSGYPFKHALDAFCKRFNLELESDFTLDAIRKSEYRYRKSISKKRAANLSTHELPPINPQFIR